MLEKQGLVTVSTDVLGVFANPLEVQRLYERAGYRCNLEVVAMPLQYSDLEDLSREHKKNFELGGVHGQLGVGLKPNDNLKRKAVDLLLPPVMGYAEMLPILPVGIRVDMIGCLTGKNIYFNVHNDVVKNNFDDYRKYSKFAKFSHLTIENGIVEGDVAKVRDLVCRFADSGAEKTCGTFDLVHATLAMSGGKIDIGVVRKFWKKTLNQIDNNFRHLHFPIGVNNDSLPILKMIEEKVMLRDLANKQKELGIHITFENQHNLIWGVNKVAEEKRLKIIREGLLKCGFNV